MRASFIQLWLKLQSSYYFIPAIMGFAAIGLSILTTAIDLRFQTGIEEYLGWFYAGTVDSSRAVLTTIAGSMISVAAVTFSLTMVAVTTAAGQYGPRLIGNFMRDRANQVTLGMFLATFIYCLMILRSVSSEVGDSIGGLVPSLSVLCALILTLISVGVLIFFIHHIPETLNVGNITGRVAKELTQQIKTGRFPATPDIEGGAADELGDPFDPKYTQTVQCRNPGFVQAVSVKGLMAWCEERGARIRLIRVPGDFALQDDPLLSVILDDDADTLTSDDREALRSFVATGRERTKHQNLLFLADELVEIAARALSPGVNDPFTAINCIHWYGQACMSLILSDDAPECLRDSSGTPRLWAKSVDLPRLLSVLFGQSRQYVAADENVARETLKILFQLRRAAPSSDKPAIEDHIVLLRESVSQSTLGEAQKERIRDVSGTV